MHSVSKTAKLIHEEIKLQGIKAPPFVVESLIRRLEDEDIEMGYTGALCAVAGLQVGLLAGKV